MQIKFKTLKLQNFKNHQDLTVNFGEITKITGENYLGKTSIGDAVTWLLYGTNTFGINLNKDNEPVPKKFASDCTKVSLLMVIDETEKLLERELSGGKTKYFIDEIPVKKTEFDVFLEQLFDKKLFLSLFNPGYFFTLHPIKEQRTMILQYVPAPSNKEVFKELPEPQAEKLATLVKKHSLENLDKKYREIKTKMEKQYIAAQSRTKTLKEQLEEQAPRVPRESLQAELSILKKQRNEIEKVIDKAGNNNWRINTLQNQIKRLLDERDQLKEEYLLLQDENIQKTCRVCKQPLQNEALKAAESEKEKRVKRARLQFDEAVAKRRELEEQLATLEYIDVSEQLEKARELQEKITPIEQELKKYDLYEMLQLQVKDAKKDEKQTLESLNESIFIIDSIKDFRAKETELQVKKVEGLFERLSIKLFEKLKTTGEPKPTFAIERDGKPYLVISKSEKIRAGLELREVLSQQSNIVVPVFVDNAESITKFKEPTGQLIMARVVAGQELKIEGDSDE